MKPLVTLEPPLHSSPVQTILSTEGFTGQLLAFAPGEERSFDLSAANQNIVFVVDGEVTIRAGEINTILDRDRATLLPKGGDCVVVASKGAPAKVLRLEVPPRQVVQPQILTVADAVA